MQLEQRMTEELTQLRDHPHQLIYRREAEAQAEHLQACAIDPDADYGQLRTLLRYQGTPCLPRQDLVAINGKAKCGKTFATAILMAAVLSGGNILGMTCTEPGLRVLCVDTEQAQYSSQRLLRRVLALGNVDYNPERMQLLNLRRLSYTERCQLLTSAIATMHPDLVVVDGVRDLLLDFNAIDESSALIGHLMTLASDFDCCIVCLLHQNKPKEDSNMRGHLGTELENKAAEVYEMSAQDGLFTLHQKISRNEPINQDFNFMLQAGANGIVLPVSPALAVAVDPNLANLPDLMAKAFGGREGVSYQEVSEQLTRLGMDLYREIPSLWNKAKEQGLVVHMEQGPGFRFVPPSAPEGE